MKKYLCYCSSLYLCWLYSLVPSKSSAVSILMHSCMSVYVFFFHDGIRVVFNVIFLYGIVCAISYLVRRIFYICCKKVHVQAEVFSKSIIFVNVFCLIFYFFFLV